MESNHSPVASQETYFAKAGRSSQGELVEQMRRSLDDPCIRAVLDAVTGFVVILNENRQILAANQELLDALERDDPGCVAGLRIGEAFNCIHFTQGTDGCGTARRCRTCGAVLAVIASQDHGVSATDECRLSLYRDQKLEALDFKVRATPLSINGYKLTAVVLHDTSDLKRREVLEQTFFHDFLNTVGGIAGWGELLRQADQPTAAREIAALAESLKQEVVTQRTLLAAERGDLVAKSEPLDAGELIKRVELNFHAHPVAHGKVLSILPLPEERCILSDATLLLRVLINMVKNAFEATDEGGTVRVGFEWRGGAGTFVVRNAGVMPELVQERVFERSFSTRSREGRGIGTYSMKLYGERYLGGSVSFTSDKQNGTQFFISLPPKQGTVQVEAPGETHQEVEAPKSSRILLVDDEEALLRLGTLLLTRLGYTVTACRNGLEAVAALRAEPDSFKAVVTDWNLPGAGGEDLIQRLTAVCKDIPIVVCSGIGQIPMEDSSAIGIHGWLSKPYTFQELAALLRSVAG